ncbi:MAG: hypothetical protein ACI8XC_004478, partial [Gammaproteobacteria bacterium]
MLFSCYFSKDLAHGQIYCSCMICIHYIHIAHVRNNLTTDKKDVRFLNITRNTNEASFFEIWGVKMVPRGGSKCLEHFNTNTCESEGIGTWADILLLHDL